MIVDCHTQVWGASSRGVPCVTECGGEDVRADINRHLEAVHMIDRAIVLAFKSRYLNTEISNEFVSDYVRRFSAKLVGFAGIDPTDADCLDEIRRAQESLGLKGITVSPALQDFHPSDTRAMRVYEECARRRLPIVFQQSHRNALAKLEYARPLMLDAIAAEFPELRIIVAHMGYPWVDETVVLLGKHRHVYADVSGLLQRPWLGYKSLLAAYEYGVMSKLLFGSDFPYRSPVACIEALYSVNQLSYGTNLVTIPREQLRGIVERDALSLLGLSDRQNGNGVATVASATDHD